MLPLSDRLGMTGWCFTQLALITNPGFSIWEILRNDPAGREDMSEEERRADIVKKFGQNGYVRIMARAMNLLNHIINICFNSMDVARSSDSLPLKILIVVVSVIGAVLELTLISLVIVFIKPKEKKTIISVILGFSLLMAVVIVGPAFYTFDTPETQSYYGGVMKLQTSVFTLLTPIFELLLGAQNLDGNSIAPLPFYIATLFGFGFQLAQSIMIQDWKFVARHSGGVVLVLAVLYVFLVKFVRQKTADAIVRRCQRFGELLGISNIVTWAQPANSQTPEIV